MSVRTKSKRLKTEVRAENDDEVEIIKYVEPKIKKKKLIVKKEPSACPPSQSSSNASKPPSTLTANEDTINKSLSAVASIKTISPEQRDSATAHSLASSIDSTTLYTAFTHWLQQKNLQVVVPPASNSAKTCKSEPDIITLDDSDDECDPTSSTISTSISTLEPAKEATSSYSTDLGNGMTCIEKKPREDNLSTKVPSTVVHPPTILLEANIKEDQSIQKKHPLLFHPPPPPSCSPPPPPSSPPPPPPPPPLSPPPPPPPVPSVSPLPPKWSQTATPPEMRQVFYPPPFPPPPPPPPSVPLSTSMWWQRFLSDHYSSSQQQTSSRMPYSVPPPAIRNCIGPPPPPAPSFNCSLPTSSNQDFGAAPMLPPPYDCPRFPDMSKPPPPPFSDYSAPSSSNARAAAGVPKHSLIYPPPPDMSLPPPPLPLAQYQPGSANRSSINVTKPLFAALGLSGAHRAVPMAPGQLPVLYDRYGQPLPVPKSSIPPPQPQQGNTMFN